MTSPTLSPLRPPSIPPRHVTRVKWENIGIISAGLAACAVVVALIMGGGTSATGSTAPLPPKQLNSTQVVANDASMATTPEAARALMVKAQLLVDEGKYDDALEVLTHIDSPLDAQVGAIAMRDRIDALRVQSDQFSDAANGAAGAGTVEEHATDAAGASTAAVAPAGNSAAGTAAGASSGASTSAAGTSSSAARPGASSGSGSNAGSGSGTTRPAVPTHSSGPVTGGLGSRPIGGTGALPPELQAIYDSADPALIAQVQAMISSSDPKAVAQLEATIAKMMSAQSGN